MVCFELGEEILHETVLIGKYRSSILRNNSESTK